LLKEGNNLGLGKKGGMTENQDIGNGHIRIPIPLATIGFPIFSFQISPFIVKDISEMDKSEILYIQDLNPFPICPFPVCPFL
jgi:hypothetical protein